jgi:tRNA (guanine-N7-)-methyltransferase
LGEASVLNQTDYDGDSRNVEGQPGPRYAALDRLLQRQAGAAFRRPRQTACADVSDWLVAALKLSQTQGRSIVVDLGCGTGKSVEHHARRRPDALVLGIDKSTDRLSRSMVPVLDVRLGEKPRTLSGPWIVRVDSIDFVAALVAAGGAIDECWLVYPNPWPKACHLSRRWYAHPLFPALLANTQRFECRTNWLIYAQEMAHVLRALGREPTLDGVAAFEASSISAFEEKYRRSGHECWRILA